MKLILALLLLLAGCRRAEPTQVPAAEKSAESACSRLVFEGSRFTVCRAPEARIELRSSGADGRPLRSFVALEHVLGPRAKKVLFAMNAGMFDDHGRPIGLLVESGREIRTINRREGGGNFHLTPNGVFLVRRDGRTAVVTSSAYKPSADILYATQSGPMLVIDGKLHPRFDYDGKSRFIRNGVGIGPDGQPLFVISDEPVSFGKLARLFRDELSCRNALYFAGSVSSLWDPANDRMDSFAAIGPMVVAFKAAE